jgi:hypothetical protein
MRTAMPLEAGTRLGAYEVVSALGAGGMGSACGLSGARMRAASASGGGAPRAVRNASLAHAA